MIKFFERFMIFVYEERYPSGGLEDVVDSFSDLDSAIQCFESWKSDYVILFDRVEGVIILSSGDFEQEK